MIKRFFDAAAPVSLEGGFGVALDGKPVRTPARAALAVPKLALAEAIAAEWNAQGPKIDPRSMPFTGLTNAAIDRIAPDPAAFAHGLAVYAESDLLAYRADHPADLVARQAAEWDPIVTWARARYDVDFLVRSGIIHQPQPQATLARLRDVTAAHSPFQLGGLQPVVTISGSLLIALALAEGGISADDAWAAGQLDELYQEEQWGVDELAVKAREAKRRDFDIGVQFLELVS